MRVLFISHMFPNRKNPLSGIFLLEKVKALSSSIDVKVVAPVSFFPLLRPFNRIADSDIIEGISISHPKYLTLPNLMFNLRWLPYHRMLGFFFKKRE